MDKAWVIIFIMVILIFVVGLNIIMWGEDKILFYPSHKQVWKPKQKYDDVYINVKNPHDSCRSYDKRSRQSYVHAWHFNNFPGRKTIIYMHGNTGNISHRGYIIDICKQFELNLLIFDYRGFGKSSGIPCKDYLRADGEAAYKYLHKVVGVRSDDIIIWGESLGGIVAVWTASKFKCRSLILLCTFSSLDDAIIERWEKGESGRSTVSALTSLVSWRMDLMPNKDYIRHVRCPVVIMHSKEDDMIPYECSKILYKNVTHRSKLLMTIRGRHSGPIITLEQLNKLFLFCDVDLPIYERYIDVPGMLKNLETVAEKHNLFMD